MALNPRCGRVRTAEHAPRDRFYLLERRHGLVEIVERGARVLVERRRVNQPHPEREVMTITENASCHGRYFAQQRLGFFEALKTNKCVCVVVCFSERVKVFFTIVSSAHASTATATASVYFLSAWYCSAPPARLIRRQSASCPPLSQ